MGRSTTAGRLPRLPATCSRYQLARSPPCDLQHGLSDRFGSAVSCRCARRHAGAVRCRERAGVLLGKLQGSLWKLLQKEPGPGEVSGPAAALPRGLHPQEGLDLIQTFESQIAANTIHWRHETDEKRNRALAQGSRRVGGQRRRWATRARRSSSALASGDLYPLRRRYGGTSRVRLDQAAT